MQTGTSRDEAADDDVFLEATQVVALAHDGGFGQDAGGFREEAAEMNRSVDSEALVMPSSTARVAGSLPGDKLVVLVQRTSERLDLLALDEGVSPGSTIWTRRSIWRTIT